MGTVTKHTVDKTERFTMHLVFKAITLAFASYLLSNGNNFCSGCFSESPNCTRTLRQEELGDGPSDLEIQIFEICDSDNNGALTWPEVMECEDNYCALVNFECPSEDDFNDFDTNQDEILSWEEYLAGLA